MSESRQPSMAELMDALNSVKDGQTQDRAAVAELEAERESLVSGSAASTEPAGPAVIGPVADLNTPASGVKPDEPADPGVPVAPPPVEDPSARAREAQEKARADALRAELMPKSNHIKAIWREAQILADQFEARIGIDWMDKPGYRAQYESIIAIAEAERELAVQLVNKNTLNSDGLQFVKERADELITICDTEIEKLRTAAATPSVDEGAKPLSAKDKILKDAQDDARRRREAMTGEGEPPPEPMMRDRKSAQLELEKLRAAYLKAKRHYETFRGAIGFITTQMFQKKRMADAESKLTEAKSQYETKLQEYKAAHISQHVEQLINQTDEVVQEERDARQKNIFLNIQD
ncbi:hypothetical protein HYV71_01250, partial [Candidatus Uhrbacteria bacterium]|nr:hypothetical protein [Candidatus Uhrbacteria bacterium]